MYLSIRTIIVVLMFIALFIHSKNNSDNKASKRILTFAIIVFLIDNLKIFPTYFIHGGKYNYIAYAAPIALCYGPLPFLYFLTTIKKRIKIKTMLYHAIPIVLFWGGYFIFIFNKSVQKDIHSWYYFAVYGAISISLLFYGGLTLFYCRKSILPTILLIRYFSWFTLLFGICGVLIVSSGISARYSTSSIPEKPSILIAVFICIGAFLVFSEVLRRFREQHLLPSFVAFEKPEMQKEPVVPKTEENKEDKVKVASFFSSEMICQSEMDIEKAALILSFTPHHLEKLIKEDYELSFTKLLRKKRIDYACYLLKQNKFDKDYHALAFDCGFHSKATFYRNFKIYKHCTPSEYRNKKI